MAADRPTLEELGITPEIAAALRAAGLVVVPIVPTPEMIKGAYWSAHDEDAEGVWTAMLQSWGASNNGNSGADKG